MRLRKYRYVTIGGLLVILAYFLLFKPEPTDLYRPDNWAQMSISVGASILTLVGIIASIVTSSENNRRVEVDESLSAIKKRTVEKKNLNPDRSLREIYDNSIQKIEAIRDSMSPIRYRESIVGIFSFFLFLASSLSAILANPFSFILGFFLVGIVLLIGYILYVFEEFVKIDVFSFPKKNKCTLSLLGVRINGIPQQFKPEIKEIPISFNQNIERIEFKVRLKGKVKNGFLHATVKYRNGLISYIPDSNTFLANFGFIDNFHLTLLEKEFDTGVLQLNGSLDLDFDVIIRSERESAENPLIWRGLIERLGAREVYKHCSVNEDFIVDSIELRLYEDPFFKPSYKRRESDCFTFNIIRTA